MNPSNRLGQEKSPYLLQHKDNPINWYPWGEEAFEAAKKEKRPIFLSIGYSTCYWCHMMEKDSFEKQEVADALNKSFICIKVDREERPDVDQVYMETVLALTGHGGWPMSVFLTPDLKPFFAGTFFYQDQFLEILEQIVDTWKEDPDSIASSADHIFGALSKEDVLGETEDSIPDEAFFNCFKQLKNRFDISYGGFGNAPKFPPSSSLLFLMRFYNRTKNEEALKMINKTLDSMARGGIHDHLGGGFSRYSVDAEWLTPHFEKMLYDNALISLSYLEGYQLTGNEMYSSVATSTLDYVLREMTDKDGGFYSAQDAGEVGKEGEFYVWRESEIKELLSEEEYTLARDVYSFSEVGNFEHKQNILHMDSTKDWSIKQDPILQSAQEKLLKRRNEREFPHKDDKVLTAWTSMMISSMAKGYQVLGDNRYLAAATKAADFILETLYVDGTLLRRYRDGESKVHGFLDDHVFLVKALIDLYETTFDVKWLEKAVEIQAAQDLLFLDQDDGGYFFSHADDQSIIFRKKIYTDGAVPADNAVALWNLTRLYHLTLDESYKKKAEALLKPISSFTKQYPAALSASLIGVDFINDSSKEVVIVGGKENRAAFVSELAKSYSPNKILIATESGQSAPDLLAKHLNGKELEGGKTTFYVCQNQTCNAPTTDAKEAIKMVLETKSLA